MGNRPLVEIHYCTQCRWLLRAAWMAQELLTAFEAELGGVTLVPGSDGVFEVRVDGRSVWSREAAGASPSRRLTGTSISGARQSYAPGSNR